MQEIKVQSLGWEDPLEKRMATHFSILAWRISWTEEPFGLQFLESQSGAWLSNYTVRQKSSYINVSINVWHSLLNLCPSPSSRTQSDIKACCCWWLQWFWGLLTCSICVGSRQKEAKESYASVLRHMNSLQHKSFSKLLMEFHTSDEFNK